MRVWMCGCVYICLCTHTERMTDWDRKKHTEIKRHRETEDRETETERGYELSINTKINLQTNFKNTQGHIPGLHFRATMMVQHLQNRIYKGTRMLFRTHDHLAVYRKSHRQSSTARHEKSPEEITNRRNIPQHNEGYTL